MEDHYKIVAIISKKGNSSKVEYSYVPYQWVKDGFVFWPSKRSQTLRDNPSSAPEPGWKKYKCKIKKDFIVGKEEAELWEEEYVNASCTESEETLAINRQLRIIDNNDNEMNKTNIDVLFDNLITSQPNINATASTNIATDSIFLTLENEPEIVVSVDSSDEACNPTDNVLVSRYQEQVTLNTIYEKLQKIEERQQKIEESQSRMLEMRRSDNSSLKLTLDKLYTMIKELPNGIIPRPTTSYEKPNESEFASKFIFPLNTLLDVQAFNSEIEKNANYKKYLLDNLRTIGGTEGNEEGKIVARNLLAILFTKEVLTNFSWTGISRTTGVEKKEAFQSYCGILNFFTEILLLADSRWNATKNDNLFKMHILKHAKQINEASKKKKQLRAGRQEQSDEVPDSTDSNKLPLQNVVHAEQE